MMGGGWQYLQIDFSPDPRHSLASACAHTFGILGRDRAAEEPRKEARPRGGARARDCETEKVCSHFATPSGVPCPMPMLIPSHPIPSPSTTQHNSNSSFKSASQPGAQLASRQFLSLGSSGFAPPFLREFADGCTARFPGQCAMIR
jgi:hypothetical protein